MLKKLFEATDLENRRVILDLAEPDKSAKVSELGCSPGNLNVEVGRRIGTTNLWGVDVIEEFIRQFEAKGIKATAGDLNGPLPMDSESFDVVLANQVLEHLHHTDLFIKEVQRVLRRGVRGNFNAESGSMA